MTAPRMTDEQFALHERGEARQKGDLLREVRRARVSESALLARVERLEAVARHLVHVPLRDCPWGCEPDEGHHPRCPVTLARATLSEKP